MASDLLSIAGSGARAAKAALDVTAQNIANASSEGYVRRTVRTAELAPSAGAAAPGAINLAGVRVAGVARNADVFRQSETRRTGADAARAAAEVEGLENVEAAVEKTAVYDAIVRFEAGLQQLQSDPTDGALRASVVESGRTMAQTFNVAADALDAVGEQLRFEARGGVDSVNGITGELAKLNQRLARAADASSDQAALLDRRDMLLEQLSGQVGIATSFGAGGTVSVTLGGATGPALVSGGDAAALAMQAAADGTIGFTLQGAPVTVASGAIAGKALALGELANTRGQLDAVAAGIVGAVNTAQAGGVDLKGEAGQPIFAGTGAADIAMIASGGGAIAAASAGSGANSRDATNLAALRSALADADPAEAMNAVLFGISSAVAGRTVTRDTLAAIAGAAKASLQAQAGVDLDQEAVNLVRFQQAFQASGRVMQVASDLFDSILAIR